MSCTSRISYETAVVSKLPLPPIVPLRPGSDLDGLTSMTWKAITPTGRRRFLKDDLAGWQAENVRLACRVRERDDDEALIQLVRRDPRYVGTDLVAAKVLLWKLQVVHGMAHVRRGATRVRRTAERARQNLARLASAITFVTGRGNQTFMNHHLLLLDFENAVEAVEAVAAMISAGKSNVQIAKATELAESIIEQIRRFPRRLTQHAEEVTLDQYPPVFDVDQLRRMLRDARKFVDPEE